ncbi:MAG: TIM barrel protein [Candidatus Aenigmarchaeota archaeon]|nr:TIM barrel protein [Candidatus Aenigmarchaeota archaeon]
MKYGYMPHFGMDLFSEIRFAKRHFDFVEITLRPETNYTEEYVRNIKNVLKNFELLGHLFWGIDLSKKEVGQIEDACRFINIYKELGVRKITVHPSSGDGKSIEEIIKNNIFALKKINDFCMKNNIQLFVENMVKPPFNKKTEFDYLVKNISSLAVTLDVGHANRTSELNNFLKLAKIGHIHLHENYGEKDHLPFTNKQRLEKVIKKIKDMLYDDTITLEIFFVLKNDKYISLDGNERRKILLEQLEIIKGL